MLGWVLRFFQAVCARWRIQRLFFRIKSCFLLCSRHWGWWGWCRDGGRDLGRFERIFRHMGGNLHRGLSIQTMRQ
ncbi:hypothetical protein BD779DRAFT_1505533 [Infundibulicybe gibba]|nr:hypothetical protein BD779DRAFT_1505533 [Infundibulicybe gibba]